MRDSVNAARSNSRNRPPSLVQSMEDLSSPIVAFLALSARLVRAIKCPSKTCSRRGGLGVKKRDARITAPNRPSAATFSPPYRNLRCDSHAWRVGGFGMHEGVRLAPWEAEEGGI